MSVPKFYIVRLRADDSIVAVGSSIECAKALKISVDSFRCAVARSKKGIQNKYEIDILGPLNDEQGETCDV